MPGEANDPMLRPEEQGTIKRYLRYADTLINGPEVVGPESNGSKSNAPKSNGPKSIAPKTTRPKTSSDETRPKDKAA